MVLFNIFLSLKFEIERTKRILFSKLTYENFKKNVRTKTELSTNQNKMDLNRTTKCSVANNKKIFSKFNVFWTTTIGLSIFNNSRDKYNSTEKV